MYNGIGLETARGSGTNGYIQRNLSFIRRHKDNVDYKSEEELRKLDSQLNRGPSREILDHERKRKVELKCMEMQELMEEQGYSEEEIDRKVSIYRQMLMENLQASMTTSSSSGNDAGIVEKDDTGRPVAKQTHQIAEASQARNDQLRAAFGLSEFYKDGTSLDPQRKDKERAAEALAAAQKTYTMLDDDDDESSSSSVEQKKKKTKQKEKEKSGKSGSREKGRKKRSRHQQRNVEPEERQPAQSTMDVAAAGERKGPVSGTADDAPVRTTKHRKHEEPTRQEHSGEHRRKRRRTDSESADGQKAAEQKRRRESSSPARPHSPPAERRPHHSPVDERRRARSPRQHGSPAERRKRRQNSTSTEGVSRRHRSPAAEKHRRGSSPSRSKKPHKRHGRDRDELDTVD